VVRRVHLLLLRLFRRLPRRGRRAVVHLVAPSFTVGAMCFIERDDGSILLVRHSYRDRWGVPGGLLARGERVERAAVREVREEVGLDVELVGEPAVVVAAKQRRVDIVYRATPAAGADVDNLEPRSPEIETLRWWDPTTLPDLQHETAEAFVALARASRWPASPVLIPTVEEDTGRRRRRSSG
jgi:8-oxo-dGTP diphosphatase